MLCRAVCCSHLANGGNRLQNRKIRRALINLNLLANPGLMELRCNASLSAPARASASHEKVQRRLIAPLAMVMQCAVIQLKLILPLPASPPGFHHAEFLLLGLALGVFYIHDDFIAFVILRSGPLRRISCDTRLPWELMTDLR
jgi:hypothetical protein